MRQPLVRESGDEPENDQDDDEDDELVDFTETGIVSPRDYSVINGYRRTSKLVYLH